MQTTETHIVLESSFEEDNYTSYVCEKYDLQMKEKVTSIIPMINVDELNSFEWNIGLICGNSGSGKSTILNKLGEIKTPTYDFSKPICSQFPHLSEQEVCDLLSSMGLASVPLWLHKPNELSNGEKARLDLCWLITNAKEGEILLIDEFTSVINRSAAQSLSYCFQRYVRKHGLKVILASCHYDCVDFLNCDFIYNLNKQENGLCEIERFIYTDSKDYEVYSQIKPKNELTEKKKIQ
jgi:ABC-type lipoprotein export system ATPase subunit